MIYRGTAAGLAELISAKAERNPSAKVVAYVFDETRAAHAWRLRVAALAKSYVQACRAIGEPANERDCARELGEMFWPGRKPGPDDLDAAEAFITELFTT